MNYKVPHSEAAPACAKSRLEGPFLSEALAAGCALVYSLFGFGNERVAELAAVEFSRLETTLCFGVDPEGLTADDRDRLSEWFQSLGVKLIVGDHEAGALVEVPPRYEAFKTQTMPGAPASVEAA